MSVQQTTSRTDDYMTALSRHVAGGVNSHSRVRDRRMAFASGSGGVLRDLDGQPYVDCTLGMGPVVIGHAEPTVVRAVTAQAGRAEILAAESPQLLRVTEHLTSWIPSAERMLFVSTGTEAVQAALRLARMSTGRHLVLKFHGHFHGWLPPVYTNIPGSPMHWIDDDLLQAEPASADQSAETLDGDVIITLWGDDERFARVMDRLGDQLAAVIMEPIPYNYGSFLAPTGYLEQVREQCSAHGVPLIFDEVVSGIRSARGGAQERYGVTPDLTVLAKALGNGVPIAAVAGRQEIFDRALAAGYHPQGTYNANPLSVAGAAATLEFIAEHDDFHNRLETLGSGLEQRVLAVAEYLDAPLTVNRVGSAMQLFWGRQGDGLDYPSCATADGDTLSLIISRMLRHGVYSPIRGMTFVCYRHTEPDLDRFAEALRLSVQELRAEHQIVRQGVHS